MATDIVLVEHEFWREQASGKIWAVELEDGVVSGCCGPLTASEVEEEFLPTLDYSSEAAAYLEAHREEFALCEYERPR